MSVIGKLLIILLFFFVINHTIASTIQKREDVLIVKREDVLIVLKFILILPKKFGSNIYLKFWRLIQN